MNNQRPLEAVEECSPADAVEGLLALVGAAEPILDITYGNGEFWKGSSRTVHGYDINAERGTHGQADFTQLGFADRSYPTVVYDPPFHPFVGSAEEERFSGLGRDDKELKLLFQAGVREAWRVSAKHLIVKCQSYIHNHSPQWMPLWAIEICGEPFEWLIALRKGKRISGRWTTVRSLRRRHADYLLFSKTGNKR